MKINEVLQNNIIGVYGVSGKTWLEQLSGMLRKYENTLNINIDTPFEDLSFNYVAPCTLSNGEPAVFKFGVPNKELTTEIAALKHFNGGGCVRLIDASSKAGWLLIERLNPGMMLLFEEDDENATRIFVETMQKLHMPIDINENFPTVEAWLKGFDRLRQTFDGGTGPFPEVAVDYAEKLSTALLQSPGQSVLLHGDLHHCNILSGERGWLSIDPKGVIGEAEYEIGAFMKNPMPRLVSSSNLKALFKRRIDIIAEMTGFDRQKIYGWSFVKAMLSAWWGYEEKTCDIKPLLHCATILKDLLSGK